MKTINIEEILASKSPNYKSALKVGRQSNAIVGGSEAIEAMKEAIKQAIEPTANNDITVIGGVDWLDAMADSFCFEFMKLRTYRTDIWERTPEGYKALEKEVKDTFKFLIPIMLRKFNEKKEHFLKNN